MLLFALYRERAGASELWLELPSHCTVADARHALLRRVPGLAPKADDIVVALNAEYARPDQPLKDGDELALIPPVSGGQARLARTHEPRW